MLKRAIHTFTNKILITVFRFPLPCLFSLLFTIVSIVEVKENEKILKTLFCGMFWFIALKLFAESIKWNFKRYYAIGIITFLTIIYQLCFYNSDFVTFYFLGSGLFLSIFIAPFLNKKSSNDQIWTFNYRLWSHICFTILSAIILFLGIILIPASLKLLFEINFNEKIYLDIWIIVAAFFAPIVAMSGIPDKYDMVEQEYPSAYRIILAYIIMPVLCIYTVILYGYIIKILIDWSLPKGGVVYLVSIYSSISIVAYLASYPLHNVHGIIKLFSTHFFKILLLPLVLLSIAIGFRVNEYGFTEERYIILIYLGWFTISSFFILTKYRHQALKFIFITISALLILASFGPWGGFSVSSSSQIGRLKKLLEKNHMVAENQIQKTAKEISLSDRIEISSIIKYLVDTKKSDELKKYFTNLPNTKNLSFQGVKEIMSDFGVVYAAPIKYSNNFYFHAKEKPYISIAGYDYLIESYFYSMDGAVKNIKLDKDRLNLAIKLDLNTNQYIIKTNDKDEITFELNDLDFMRDNSLILDKKNSNISARLIIKTSNGIVNKDNYKPIISSINTILLIKILN